MRMWNKLTFFLLCIDVERATTGKLFVYGGLHVERQPAQACIFLAKLEFEVFFVFFFGRHFALQQAHLQGLTEKTSGGSVRSAGFSYFCHLT